MIPDLVLWLLPALFVIHDAEEVLWLPAWLRRNRDRIATRFPALSHRLLPHLTAITPKVFAMMAAEELLLLVGVTLYAFLGGSYYPWLTLFLGFGLHLIVHLAQAIALRGYLPALATALLCFLALGWMISEVVVLRIFTAWEFVLCGGVGIAVAALNLWMLHSLATIWTARASEVPSEFRP